MSIRQDDLLTNAKMGGCKTEVLFYENKKYKSGTHSHTHGERESEAALHSV